MIEALRGFLRDRELDLPPGATELSGSIIAGIDRERSSKVTCLLFDRAGSPVLAAKVARSASAERALAAEHAVLRQLWRSESSAIHDCVPRPIALARIGGRLSLVTTAVQGGPMSAQYYSPGHVADPALVAQDFHIASVWLRRFQVETYQGDSILDENSLEAWMSPVLERYRAEIGWSDAEARFFDTVAECGRELNGTKLPLVAVHGDYWMGNLLANGREVTGVVDWELGRGTGLPFTDIYKFPTSYGFYLDRSGRSMRGEVPGHPERSDVERRWRGYGRWPNLIGFGYSYFGRGWFPEQVRRFVLGNLSALGIPPAVNRVFFPLFIAQQAMVLDVPAFRDGYRSLLLAFGQEKSSTWLWEGTTGAMVASP